MAASQSRTVSSSEADATDTEPSTSHNRHINVSSLLTLNNSAMAVEKWIQQSVTAFSCTRYAISYHTKLQVNLRDIETGPKVNANTYGGMKMDVERELVFFLYI